jgi:hypothetical protein
MRDLNAELRGTFLIVIGTLVCLSVIVGLLLFVWGDRSVGPASRPRWRALPPDRVEQPTPQPAAAPVGRSR